MKALADTLRQVGRDLVEKRLWPVALLLVVVAVAAPMLIGGSAPEVAAPAAVATDPPAVAAVTPPGAARTKTTRGGRIDDPFYDPPEPARESSGTTAASGGGASTAAPAGDGGAASASAPAPPTKAAARSERPPTPARSQNPPTPAQAVSTSRYYRAVVHWGTGAAKPHPIARLTPLGARGHLAALYLGITRADGLWAIFVLGPNSTSRGDGICKPGTGCRMIGLKAGDRQRVTVRGSDGRITRQFWLRIRSVKSVVTTERAARAGRARVHREGLSVLREMRQVPVLAAVLAKARYNRASGLLDATAPRTDVEKAGE